MPFSTITQVLSIKVLVALLAATGISACLLMSGLLYYSNSDSFHGQKQLIELTSVQDAAGEIEFALIELISHQVDVYAATKQADLDALPGTELSRQMFDRSLDTLKGVNQDSLHLAITNTERAYTRFLDADQRLLDSTRTIIFTKLHLSIRMARMKTQLEKLSLLTDGIFEKLVYSAKGLNRRNATNLEKGISFDTPESKEQITEYMSADASKRIGLSQRVSQNLLNFASLVHEFNGIDNMDRLVSVRDNQAQQLIDETKSLLIEIKAVLDDDVIAENLVNEIRFTFSILSRAVFAEENSLFVLRKKHIEESAIQRESIQQSKLSARDVNDELKTVLDGISEIRKDIVEKSSSALRINTNLAVAIGSIVLVILVAMGLFTFYCIAKPLREIAEAMDEIAQGEGDLTKRLDTNSIHEVAQIASGFNQFVEKAKRVEHELNLAQKLESVGRLAAGVAHEINTPVQYVSDNNRFLEEAFADLLALQQIQANLLEDARIGKIDPDLIVRIDDEIENLDLAFLMGEIPKAISQAIEGTTRIAKIVGAMKQFSHPGSDTKKMTSINESLEATLTVSSNEWKYIATIEKDFDRNLPSVYCLPGELGQVFLNLIVNAAHAIVDVVGDGGKQKGVIKLSTRHLDNEVEIRISDTGPGIPEASRDKLFESFFTTKEVGRGTGQGLSIARTVVVDQHGGSLDFETEMDVGTTFIIRLPIGEEDINAT